MVRSSRTPQLSVVVPTYNRAPLLRRILVSLAEQRNPPAFEVVVAGSADDSEQVVAEFRDRLVIRYRYQEDRGYRAAKARNIGCGHRQRADPGVPGQRHAGRARSARRPSARAHRVPAVAPRSPVCGSAVIGCTYGSRPYNPTPGLAEAFTRMSPQQGLAITAY